MAFPRFGKFGVAFAAVLVATPVIYLGGRAALDWRRARLMDDRADEIIALMRIPPQSDFHQTVDAVRMFINDHSQDKVDAVFRAMNGNKVAFADGVIAHARDPSLERVHMECSTRTNLFGRVLRRMGYETRTIALFKAKGGYTSHSFLDVLNPEAKRWETQDADYDLYWVSLASGERVSLAEAAGNLDDLRPCGRSLCGWDVVSRDGHRPKSLVKLLDILSVTSKERDVRYSVYTPRANVEQIFDIGGRTGTYCQVMAKRCRDGFHPIGEVPAGSP
jgi:hypothetical protein